jgi:hypothetical protein
MYTFEVTATLAYGPPLYEATISPPVLWLRSVLETMCQLPVRSVQLGPRSVESARLMRSRRRGYRGTPSGELAQDNDKGAVRRPAPN